MPANSYIVTKGAQVIYLHESSDSVYNFVFNLLRAVLYCDQTKLSYFDDLYVTHYAHDVEQARYKLNAIDFTLQDRTGQAVPLLSAQLTELRNELRASIKPAEDSIFLPMNGCPAVHAAFLKDNPCTVRLPFDMLAATNDNTTTETEGSQGGGGSQRLEEFEKKLQEESKRLKGLQEERQRAEREATLRRQQLEKKKARLMASHGEWTEFRRKFQIDKDLYTRFKDEIAMGAIAPIGVPVMFKDTFDLFARLDAEGVLGTDKELDRYIEALPTRKADNINKYRRLFLYDEDDPEYEASISRLLEEIDFTSSEEEA